MYTCGQCNHRMAPEQNCRMVGRLVVCMRCYGELLGIPRMELARYVQPLTRWQRFWRWFA